MAINYRVAADVVDIRTDAPRSSDVFLVDTNVWFWMTYSRAGSGDRPPRHYQVTDYPLFVRQALAAHANIHRCELSLPELASLVEKTELAIYSAATGFDRSVPNALKIYRHNEIAERSNVVGEIQSAWSLLTTMAKAVSFVVDETLGAGTIGCCSNCQLDAYDAMMVGAASQCNISQIITDDGDYCTIPGITVFTANRSVIGAANLANRLVVR
ncbi:MAG: hypothetical protein ABFE08_23445 [Armatimonadia bacterium]